MKNGEELDVTSSLANYIQTTNGSDSLNIYYFLLVPKPEKPIVAARSGSISPSSTTVFCFFSLRATFLCCFLCSSFQEKERKQDLY